MSVILDLLKEFTTTHCDGIEAWFEEQYKHVNPLFYSSVDLRHSGKKLAPVDTNLFPAGFNNLSQPAKEQAGKAIRLFLDTYYPNTKHILLIPESHTRNGHYLDNVVTLKTLVEESGREVFLGNINLSGQTPYELSSASGKPLTIYPAERKGGALYADSHPKPDLVLLNNDLTSGVPEVLNGLEQPILPSIALGWHTRRKSTHFQSYNNVIRNFTEQFPLDGWLISTEFQKCGSIDFKSRSGLECVAIAVEQVLHTIRQKYEEHGVTDEPYVFIKADMGTYGMGIMTAKSGEELFSMNKDIRKKMGAIKGGIASTEVIIQEGIPTIDTVQGKAAEPFLYLVGSHPVGCIYRVNEARGAFGNLNSPGMTFEQADCAEDSSPFPCKLSPHGLIARLASLAAAKESSYQHHE